MLSAITGINWGDEGKGRMVDLLSQEYDIVVRYQGGNNAGHTVVNPKGTFILNLLPSGILREDVVNVMGNGMVIDLEHLSGEIARLRDAGITITPERLKISDKAVICMPYHREQDCLEEERLGDARYGSTRRGIAPVYGDKYMKKAIRMGELLEMDSLKARLKGILEWKNLAFTGIYHANPIDEKALFAWLEEFGRAAADFVCDTSVYLDKAARQGKKILFEAQLGALRDIDFGIYPFTSSSSTIGAYAPIGAGIPNHKLDCSIGIMKAYSTCVGEGPFVCELFGEEAERLRQAGGEYGAATGRPRRVGPFDVPASRYGVRMQGANELALTKLDVLSGMEKIPVCISYRIDAQETTEFPTGAKLQRAKPVLKTLQGWNCPISHCRSWQELPCAAREYVLFLEKQVGCPIRYISVGAEREQYLVREI